ncbi:MAG: Tex family protein [Bacteroidales bacterium]|nr:Tex family protein [Bacteroidales bacterium]
MADIIALTAANLNLPPRSVRATARLLSEGATVPFISRYRKEHTGNLDEQAIRSIETELLRLTQLDERRQSIIASIESQGKLTDELRHRLDEAATTAALEDPYLPYRPKRRTRATIAREHGLEPLARMIMSPGGLADVEASAARFTGGEVATPADAVAGASDIIAEWVSESPRARNGLRGRFRREAVIKSSIAKGKEAEADKYHIYERYSHPLRSIASHNYLALRRGQDEGLLKLSVDIDDERAIDAICEWYVPRHTALSSRQVIERAVADGYRRLLRPSIENEMAAEWKERADRAAITLFADNLRQLLMASPLRGRRIIAIDPGFRTGCKVVALDAAGNLLADDVIYPNPPQNDTVVATRTLMHLIDRHEIDAIALGDRTASRETEAFLRSSGISDFVELFVVSENGASVYSASDIAREEFPDKDVTVRGAVSIGRRLIDPLAELVKIDPKSIGVGQYQHDVDQGSLRDALDFTVMSCVNQVGVDLNTASPQLLAYISGIGKAMAAKIVDWRRTHGAFASRRALLDVPRLGAKVFEQAAGFLRVPGSANPLDNTGIHPESYHVVERMAHDIGVAVADLVDHADAIDRIDAAAYADAGDSTVSDIIAELRKPGRDPRTEAANVEFDSTIHTIDDLSVGMILPGKVNNITAFGAFIDIGIKENGLLHVSQMGKRRVSNPSDVVRINQILQVKIIDIDLKRHRIALSIKDL